MAYPDADTLKAESSGEPRERLDALDTDQLTAVYTVAVADVERHCNQSFGGVVEDHTETLDGVGGDRIELPMRLITLTALSVDQTALDATNVEVSADGLLLLLRAPGTGTYYDRALRDAMGQRDPHFVEGFSNIHITGDWGWADPPADVVTGIRMTMEDIALTDANELSATLRAYQRLGIGQISQGPLNVQFTAQAPVSPRVALILEKYVLETAVGVVI